MTKKKIKPFKIRCSQIGVIMTNPKTKEAQEAGELSQGAQTYCKTWLKEQLYDRDNEFASKYTDKGNIVEQDSVDFAADKLEWGFVFKNEEYKENDFLTGTCDVVLQKRIIDMKNAYDLWTFPIFEDKPKDKNNEQQLQGYMELWDKEEAQIVYTLMDTPEHLIEKEIRSYAYNNDIEEASQEMIDGIVRNHTYDDIPDEYKIKAFEPIARDREYMAKVKERVAMCQAYINELLIKINY